jgi:hypothetical protein
VKRLDRDKHSSLFALFIEVKELITLAAGRNIIKTLFVIDAPGKIS